MPISMFPLDDGVRRCGVCATALRAGQRHYCCRACSTQGTAIARRDKPRGHDGPLKPPYRMRCARCEHRVIAEAVYGPLPPGWVVHHANDVKRDNTPANLVPMARADHTRLHLPRRLRGYYRGRACRQLLAAFPFLWSRFGALDCGGLALIGALAGARADADLAAWEGRRAA